MRELCLNAIKVSRSYNTQAFHIGKFNTIVGPIDYGLCSRKISQQRGPILRTRRNSSSTSSVSRFSTGSIHLATASLSFEPNRAERESSQEAGAQSRFRVDALKKKQYIFLRHILGSLRRRED
jgi:hypothetical protein